MNQTAAASALAMLFALCGRAAAQDRTLTLPQPLHAGDTAFIEVTLGVIGPGHEIEITTPDGRTLGVISPHGIRAGHGAGSYTLPLPADAICHGRVAVTLRVTRSDAAPRIPTADEVRGVRVVVNAATPR
jgi:hypothetical protein